MLHTLPPMPTPQSHSKLTTSRPPNSTLVTAVVVGFVGVLVVCVCGGGERDRTRNNKSYGSLLPSLVVSFADRLLHFSQLESVGRSNNRPDLQIARVGLTSTKCVSCRFPILAPPLIGTTCAVLSTLFLHRCRL